MTKTVIGFACCWLALAAFAAAQDSKSKDEHKTVTQVLDRTVTNVEHIKDAVPDD